MLKFYFYFWKLEFFIIVLKKTKYSVQLFMKTDIYCTDFYIWKLLCVLYWQHFKIHTPFGPRDNTCCVVDVIRIYIFISLYGILVTQVVTKNSNISFYLFVTLHNMFYIQTYPPTIKFEVFVPNTYYVLIRRM